MAKNRCWSCGRRLSSDNTCYHCWPRNTGGGGYSGGGHDYSGSSREENSTFKAVCDRKGMSRDQRQQFHHWLHSNHGIDGYTTDLKFNDLLHYAERWME